MTPAALIRSHCAKLAFVAEHGSVANRIVAKGLLAKVARYERAAADPLSLNFALGMLGPNGIAPAIDHEHSMALRRAGQKESA